MEQVESLPAIAAEVDKHRRARVAVVMLSFCCLCWGLSFPVMQLGFHAIESHLSRLSPRFDALAVKLSVNATFNGWRFLLAALLYGAITLRAQMKQSWRDIKGGLVIGIFFAAGMFAQIAGLRYTLPSVSSFLTSLVVVFAPIAQALIFRRRVGGWTWLAVVIAIAGIAALGQHDAASAACNTIACTPPINGLGEIFTILGAVLFTGQLLALDHYGQHCDPSRLTLVMFLVNGVLSVAAGAIFGGETLYNSHTILGAVGDPTVQWTLLSMVVFSSVIAIHCMIAYQPRVSPATASVVYCLEPVFATMFSFAFQTESVTSATLMGGVLILTAVLVVTKET